MARSSLAYSAIDDAFHAVDIRLIGIMIDRVFLQSILRTSTAAALDFLWSREAPIKSMLVGLRRTSSSASFERSFFILVS